MKRNVTDLPKLGGFAPLSEKRIREARKGFHAKTRKDFFSQVNIIGEAQPYN
jgi:hypothetical protein